MSIGVLLFLNLLTVPFLYEAEVLMSGGKKAPHVSEIVRLRATKTARWTKGVSCFHACLPRRCLGPYCVG